MNWLVLCSHVEDAKPVVDFLEVKKSKPVVTELTSEFSVKKLKALACGASHCVALVTAADAVLPQMLYTAGYFSGKELPVFVVVTDKPDPKLKEYTQLYNSFSHFKTIPELIENLEKDYHLFLEEEERQRAHKILFDDGIPFTPDCFSTYIAKDKEDICQLFIDAGMDINCRDSAGTPMLSIAARSGRENMCQWLVDNGAAIDAVSQDRGYSAVMDAVWKGSTPIVEKLIALGANLNFVGNDGQTALIIATGSTHTKICRLLVENGADPTVSDHMGMSALKYAELFKKTELVELYKEYVK